MRHLLTQLRVRSLSRTLAGTSFCDECGEVCTPSCRKGALLAGQRDAAQWSSLYRR